MDEKWENGNFCDRNLTVLRIYGLLSHLLDTNLSTILSTMARIFTFLPSDILNYRMSTVTLHKNYRGWVMDFVYFAQIKILCSTPNQQPPNPLNFFLPFPFLIPPISQTLLLTPLKLHLDHPKIKIKNSKIMKIILDF